VALGDRTAPDGPEIVVFYRPSFGRLSDSGTGLSKQFGEFDFLIGTPDGVYPIESKDGRCSELNRATMVLTLREEQLRRHRIFRTYRMLWQKHRPNDWNQFRSAALDEFKHAHPGWTMAEKRNLLAENLEFVLRSLQNCGEKIQDTLLLFRKAAEPVSFTHDHGFTCISMVLEMGPGSNFVLI
jgi:hypothetical protein